MLDAPRRSARRDALARYYAPQAGSVAPQGGFLVTPEQVVLALGVGRVVIGSALLAAPATSLRLLGLDSGTARRVTHLARMAAARDVGLGAGALAAAPGRAAASWAVAGAVADAVDAVAIAGAVRRGTARGVLAVGVVAGAAASAAAGFWAASRLRRGRL